MARSAPRSHPTAPGAPAAAPATSAASPARDPAGSGVTGAPHPAAAVWDGVLAVVVVALVASLAGLRNDYAQDDLYLIRDNLRVHSPANWRGIVTSAYWPPPWNQELYRPLTSLLHAFQFALGSGDPLIFRVTSYLLYAAAAAGTFLLAYRLLPRAVALGIGLLFAAHPVHVEAVALGVGQAELIVGFATVATVGIYLVRRRLDRVRPRDWAAMAGLYLIASLAKEQGLLLPAMLVLAEIVLISGPVLPRIRRLGPGYCLLAAIAAAVVAGRLAILGGQFARNFTAEALEGLTAWGRFLTMLQVVPQWLRLLVWPAHLQADYSPQEITAFDGFGVAEVLGIAILVGGAAAVGLARRRAPVVGFGLAWCAVALFPVSNLLMVSGIVLAERTLFLPSVGFVIAVGGAVGYARARRSGGPSQPAMARLWGPWGAFAITTGIVVVLGVIRSAERHRVWRNEAFFSVRSVQDAPRSYRTRRAYAEILFELGQRQLAVDAYGEAIRLAPRGTGWRVRNDFARRLGSLGDREGEVAQLEASLAEAPDQEEARGNLIAALLVLGRYLDASEQADSAIARFPARTQVFGGLRAVADSALRVGAPTGLIRIRINTTPVAGGRTP